jgi:hypothetical protein
MSVGSVYHPKNEGERCCCVVSALAFLMLILSCVTSFWEFRNTLSSLLELYRGWVWMNPVIEYKRLMLIMVVNMMVSWWSSVGLKYFSAGTAMIGV